MSLKKQPSEFLNPQEVKSTSFLDGYINDNSQKADAEYCAFSFGRVGNRIQPMVKLIKTDGFTIARPYGIESPLTDRLLELNFGDVLVRFEGNHLGVLFDYLFTYRCSVVLEYSMHSAMSIPPDEPIVTSLHIVRAKF